eukprot:SAG31_NODE_16718_length_696_cov_2.133556_1_plen_78_part_00
MQLELCRIQRNFFDPPPPKLENRPTYGTNLNLVVKNGCAVELLNLVQLCTRGPIRELGGGGSDFLGGGLGHTSVSGY